MRCILDPHAFLWLAGADDRLSARAQELFEDPSNDFVLSIGSIWEMAIKLSLGKLTLGRPLSEVLRIAREEQGIGLLAIAAEHATHVAALEFHHRDPFDRLLVAQSLLEGLPIVSIDGKLDAYGVQRLW